MLLNLSSMSGLSDMPSLSTFLSGFAISLSLILAIGAQNAFVLKQGLKKQHVLAVCLICALSDAVLLSAGILGFGNVIMQYPSLVLVSQYLGAVFLLVYGATHFYTAFTSQSALTPEGDSHQSLIKTMLVCLAFTWLNPHVYLDTVILMGSISTHYESTKDFLIGAVSASWLFFFSLGYGARLLMPIFQKPIAWKVLDILIGLVMWFIAISLITSTLTDFG